MTAAAKKQPGRPTLPPCEKLVVVPVRLTGAQKAKLQRIGVQRLRDWLDRAREVHTACLNCGAEREVAPDKPCQACGGHAWVVR